MKFHCGFSILAGLVSDNAALKGSWIPFGGGRDTGGEHRRRCRAAGTLILFLALAMHACICRAAEPEFDIDIPAINAAEALNRLAEQTGSVMLFSYDLAHTRKANAVSGRYTLQEGLELLLRGTGLSGGLSEKRVVVIAEEGGVPVSKGETVRKGGFFAGIVAVLAAVGAGNSRADQVGEASANPAELGEIVVTARKRAESIQNVPVSISVVGAGDIQQRGIVSKEDFLRGIPNVSLTDNGPGLQDIMIRGAYGEPFDTGPTVGVYFGDVPLAGYAIGGTADIKLVDIERVEVLRGPQGTLYGSNSLSGTLRYIPAAPDPQDFSARLEGGYSQTSEEGGSNTVVQGVLNIPLITDKLAIRAVAYQHDNDGFVRNIAEDDPVLQADAAVWGAQNLVRNQDHTAGTSYTGGRVSALWQASEALTFTLTYLTQDVTQDERPFELVQNGPYRRSTYSYRSSDPLGDADELEMDLDIANLVVEYSTDWGSILSSTSWLDQQFVRNWDIGSFFGSPLMPLPQFSTTDAEVFTQELRFTSDFDGPLQMVAGAYYEDSEQVSPQSTYFGGDPALNPFDAVLLFDVLEQRFVTQEALFGEVSYEFADRFTATVGGRYFQYDTQYLLAVFNSVLIPESDEDNPADESGSTFKASVEYAATDNALLYATWSEGFRLGRPLNPDLISQLCDLDDDGFLDGTDIPSSLDQVSSDSLENYELGAKLGFNDGRIVLNASAYLNNWNDIPVSVFPPGCITSTVVNAGEARAEGIEVESTFKLGNAFRATVGLGYVDSKLTVDSSAGEDGDRMNWVPKLNGYAALEYAFDLVGNESFARADYAYYGSYYTATGERGQRIDDYGLVNLSAGTQLGAVGVQLLVSNVMNSDSITTLEGPAAFPPGYAIRVRPRTVGIRLSYSF